MTNSGVLRVAQLNVKLVIAILTSKACITPQTDVGARGAVRKYRNQIAIEGRYQRSQSKDVS